MPGQRHESHHKICNLRYGTPGYRMNYCYKLKVSPARQTGIELNRCAMACEGCGAAI